MRDSELIYNEKIGRLRLFFNHCGAQRAVIALSGGIDSAVVVALAVEALGAGNVRVLMLPSRYSSAHSVDDSLQMAHRCSIRGDVASIEQIFGAGLQAVEPLFDLDNAELAVENMQSRIRCMLTMAVANATNALMLNTSNRTEILVGYGTLYGDTGGAVGVIADLYKDEVYALARHINKVQGNTIPLNIIEKIPSAELRDNQKDSDSLPEYDLLDPILRLLIDQNCTVGQIVELGYPREVVERVVQLNTSSAFKRLQLPPVL